jgi:LysM repeat protein
MSRKWRYILPVLFFLALFFVALPHASADTNYVVQPGDNLFRIALRHGLTTAELAAYNGIVNPDRVYAGQVLLIPDSNSAPAAPASQPAAQTAAPSTSSSVTHLVKQGEILSGIAVQYGVTVQAISQANGIYNPSLIYAGQSLAIPGATATPQPAAAAPPPAVSYGNRWIDINLTNQSLTAYENNTPVYHATISSGRYPYLTVTGQFQIYLRYQAQDMNGYRLGYDYYLPNVPYVQYFYRDFALHGTYWHNNFGTPMSHGCVNLTTADAQWIFHWSAYGTVVNVHY